MSSVPAARGNSAAGSLPARGGPTARQGQPESPGVLAHPAFSSLSNHRQSLQHPGRLFVQLALLFQCRRRRRSEREVVAAHVPWWLKNQIADASV